MTAPSYLPTLAERYEALRAQDPKRYFRSLAAALGVSEAELLVAVHAPRLTRLSLRDLPGLFGAIAAIGTVRTMTRNDDAVIEQDGTYRNLQFSPRGMGQTVGDLDLRIFGWRWQSAFAFRDETPRGIRHSFQFFDGTGTNIHKVFVDDVAAFERIVADWRAGDGLPLLDAVTAMAPSPDRPDAAVDTAALQAAWDALQDTHDFHLLLQQQQVGRLQALRLAGPERARRVEPAALEALLELAKTQGERIMIFVGNHGLVQIFIGTIHRVARTPGWLNILDPGFNLHVREEGVASVWIVRKPTRDGVVSSLECYDAQGGLIVQLFGKRAEGEGAPVGWTRLVETVEASCGA